MASASLKRLFRIQYVSDLHLEHYDKLAFPLVLTPAARYLALAGDIGNPQTDLFRSFIDYTARNWDRVFYVAGNHEYYARRPAQHWRHNPPTDMFEIQKQIKAICKSYSNVHFLHHDSPSVYLAAENVAVIGSTLWSHIPADFTMQAMGGMNDYNLIPFREGETLRCLTPADTNELHAKEREMLEAQIDYWGSQRVQVLMITHHMPSYSLISPRYESSSFNCCFASYCDMLMKPHVRAWIYGHTHNAGVASLKHTLCAVNARGYPHESIPGFSREAWLEFPIKNSDELSECGCDELAASASGIRSPYLKNLSADEDIEFV
jgi:predicted phosphodiesterase